MKLSSNTPAIESVGLRKTYRSGILGRSRFEALKGVDFTVEQGEIFGLLGPNGAGKTTTVKVLLGIIHRTGGSATMLGERAGSRAARRQVGYLPESLRIRGHHTATSAMRYYGQLSGLSVSNIKRKEDQLLELVGLQDRKKESIKQFSKGMLQRLGLAQALLHEPQLLMLDEPTDGLDPLARSEMRNTMVRLRDEGKTIFLNSHILQEVELVCDRVAILDQGKLLYCGTVEDVGAQRDKMMAKQQWQVAIEVVGTPEQIQNALQEFQLESVEQTASETVRIQIRLEGQAEVDQVVDSIRGQKMSLVSLSKQQVSLESAFLDLLDENKSQSESSV